MITCTTYEKKYNDLFLYKLNPISSKYSSKEKHFRKYTACQLYRIPLPVQPFASQLVEINVNVDIRPLKIFKRPLATPSQSLMVYHHFCPVPVSLLSRECWSIASNEYAAFVLITFHWAIAASCQTKVAIMPANTRPAIIENIARFTRSLGEDAVWRSGKGTVHPPTQMARPCRA